MVDFADLIDLCFEEERESGGSCTVYCNMKIWTLVCRVTRKRLPNDALREPQRVREGDL